MMNTRGVILSMTEYREFEKQKALIERYRKALETIVHLDYAVDIQSNANGIVLYVKAQDIAETALECV